MTNESGLAKAGSRGGSEKGSDSGYTFKVDHSEFVGGLDVA